MKWDVKHDRAKKVIDRFLDNAGYWQESEDLVTGLTDEEKELVNAEVELMIASIRKRYKLQERLPEQVAEAEKPAEKAVEELSEKDGLKVPVCNNCHNMGQKLCRIHENPMAERMSKMIGQLAWEREWLLKNTVTINSKGQMAKVEGNVVRSQFMKRYGRSYL